MSKSKILTISVIILILLGIVMIYIGGFYAVKIILPPIITGIGFFIIAWSLHALKK